MNRWIVYQRERFPLAAHAPLVAAFSASAVCFSSLLRGHVARRPPASLVVAFTTSLLFFLQLRIADEFKDCEDDARFRPYRPVPRGLVTLPELAAIGVPPPSFSWRWRCGSIPHLVWLLVLVVGLSGADDARVLRAALAEARIRSFYMASHMVILPLIDLYATACDWRVAGERAARRPCSGSSWSATSTGSSSRSAARRARADRRGARRRDLQRAVGNHGEPRMRGCWRCS